MSIQGPPKNDYIRPPLKRRRKKRSVWQKYIWPLTKVAVFAAFVVVVGSMIASKILHPFKLYNRESSETSRIAANLHKLRKENVEFARRISYLQKPEGAAQAARKLGWVKPGEITIVLPGESVKDHSDSLQ